LPQEVQDHLFNEAVASQGESIRSQLAVFLHDKHSRKRAQLSGLDMRERGRDGVEHNLHLTTHQIGQRGSRAAGTGLVVG